MPHQCVRCSTFYDENAAEPIKGCGCGGKLFFFIKKEKLEKMRAVTANLSPVEKEQIEDDIKEIIGDTEELDEPVVLDLETIRVQKPGKYEIDIVQLFNNKPLIYKVDEGKYFIDLIRSFRQSKE